MNLKLTNKSFTTQDAADWPTPSKLSSIKFKTKDLPKSRPTVVPSERSRTLIQQAKWWHGIKSCRANPGQRRMRMSPASWEPPKEAERTQLGPPPSWTEEWGAASVCPCLSSVGPTCLDLNAACVIVSLHLPPSHPHHTNLIFFLHRS